MHPTAGAPRAPAPEDRLPLCSAPMARHARGVTAPPSPAAPARPDTTLGLLAGGTAVAIVAGWAASAAAPGRVATALAELPSLGVAVGLVVVGYLASRSFARTGTGTPGPSWWAGVRPWLLRVVPVTWLVAVVALLFAPADDRVLPTDAFSPAPVGDTSVPLGLLARSVGFVEPYLGPADAGPVSHLWPIAAVVAFVVLVVPLATWAARRVDPVLVAVGLGVAGLAFRAAVALSAPDRPDLLTWLPAQLHLLAAGMALALVVHGPPRPGGDRLGSWADRLATPAGALVAVASALGIVAACATVDLAPGLAGAGGGRGLLVHLGQAVAAVLLVAVAAVRPGQDGTSASHRAARWGNRLALGAYLWAPVVLVRWVSAPGTPPAPAHNPGRLLDVALAPTLAWTLGVTAVVAVLSWYLVERPWWAVRSRRLGRFAVGLWTIGLASFGARLWAIGSITSRDPGNGDPFYYHAQANMLADGVGFGEPIQWLTEGRFVATAIHPPAFTLWLTPASLLGARSFLAHKTLAALAGVAVVVVAAFLAKRLTGSARAGLLAGGLVALYPNLWLIDGTLWPEGLYTATVGAALLAAYRWRERPTLARAAVVGLGVGVAVLTRGEALLLLPLLCLPLAWTGRREAVRWPVHAGVMGLVALALLAPWTARNLLRFDRPVPVSTNSEEVLYYANCPDVYDGPFIGYWSFNCQERARQERVARGLPADPPGDEAERAAAWGELGRRYASDHRDRLPAVAAARVSRVWDLRYAENSARAIAIEGRPLEWSKAGLWVYRALLVPGLVGLWVIRRRGRAVWPLVAMLAMITATAIYAYGHIRFRTVGDLVLLVGAAATIDALVRRLRPGSPGGSPSRDDRPVDTTVPLPGAP